MKWILIAVAALLAVALLIIIIGTFLPQKHHVSRTVKLGHTPQEVWSLITGPPTWRPEIAQYKDLPAESGHRLWQETDKSGQTIRYEEVEAVPQRRLQTRIADKSLPFGGTWTFEITPESAGCSLTITEDGEVYNPIFRFVSRFIMGHAATLDHYLQR